MTTELMLILKSDGKKRVNEDVNLGFDDIRKDQSGC